MTLVAEAMNFLLDSRRIANKQPGGSGRLALWRSYLRAKTLPLRSGTRGQVTLLGYQVRYFEARNLIHLFREIFVRRLYDIPLEKTAPVIIDCGSNIGMSILFFKNLYPRAKIVGFEPHPLAFAALSENVERNALQDVVVHRKALSDQTGAVEFFVKEGEPGALDMSMFASRGGTPITVQTERLSTHIHDEIDLIKLDVEGAEELVLRDLEQAGKLRYVRNIVCEYHHHRDGAADRLSHTLSLLERGGFGYQIDAFPGSPTSQQELLIYAYRIDGGQGK